MRRKVLFRGGDNVRIEKGRQFLVMRRQCPWIKGKFISSTVHKIKFPVKLRQSSLSEGKVRLQCAWGTKTLLRGDKVLCQKDCQILGYVANCSLPYLEAKLLSRELQ
jgi:hypothetical protein